MEGHLRKRNNKWYYSFELGKVDGKRKRIERVGGKTKAEAARKCREEMATYENSGVLFEPSEITVSDYMEYWLKNDIDVDRKPKTKRTYESHINNHINPILGSYKIKALNPAVLQKLINDLFKAGYSKSTIEGIMVVIKSSLRYAVNPSEFIKSSPADSLRMPKFKGVRKKKPVEAFTPEQIATLFEIIPYGNTCHIPCIISYHTGLRVGEACALVWEDIDLDIGEISVKHTVYRLAGKNYRGSPKNESSVRTVSIGPTLISILKKHKKDQAEQRLRYGPYYSKYRLQDDLLVESNDFRVNLVCTYENGTVIIPQNVQSLFIKVKNVMGTHVKFHMLRHTHATMLIENGANMKDVQERLGHAVLSTTMDTYAHVTEKMKKDTVDIFEQCLK